MCLVLLSPRQDAFHRLSDSAARLQRQLAESGVPQVILLGLLYSHRMFNRACSSLAGNV